MRENEFEKKVQQKMDGFRLRPSDAVWDNVKHELRRKKKRRVVFYLFLLAGLGLLSYPGYLLINQYKQTIVEQNSTPTSTTKKPIENSVTVPAEIEKTGEDSRKAVPVQVQTTPSAEGEELLVEKEKTKNVDENIPGNETDNQVVVKRNTKPEKLIAENRVTQSKNKDLKTKGTGRKNVNKKADQPDLAQADIPHNEIKKIQAAKDAAGNPADKKDLTVIDPAAAELEQPKVMQPRDSDTLTNQPGREIAGGKSDSLENANTETGKAAIAVKKQKTLKWGFDFSAGVSEINRSALPFNGGQQSMDAYFSPLPITPGNAAYFPPLAPSAVKPGFGYRFGPAAELQLSKRSKVSVAIQYAHMSSNMKIGTYTSTSLVVNNAASPGFRVNAVYSGFHQRDYTNRYHFVQIPLAYHVQLNKGKKLPVSWVAGVSAGYLVKTNALLYDTAAGGIYYRDKNAFNKFQFNLHTGLAFQFGNKERIQWSLGPEVSLGMNKLVKDAYTRKQYLLYGGLTGRLMFTKKK